MNDVLADSRQIISAYKSKNYSKVIELVQKEYDIFASKTPYRIQFLTALAYMKTGSQKLSLKTLNAIIKTKFRRVHLANLKSYQENEGADELEDLPKKLLAVYITKATVQYRLFVKNFEELNEKERDDLFDKIIMYTEICMSSEYKEDAAEEFQEDAKAKYNELKAMIYQSSWFTGLHYVSWRDELTLTSPEGIAYPIRTTNSGLMAILGYKWGNLKHEWNIQGGYARATATVGTDTSTPSYLQSSVPVSLLGGFAEYLYRPITGGIGFGISLPVLLRAGDYTTPTTSTGTWKLDSDTIITYGYLFNSKWTVGNWDLQVRFGKVSKMPSSFWTIGVNYHF